MDFEDMTTQKPKSNLDTFLPDKLPIWLEDMTE